ncbi:hypothetical protein GW17_00051080 [Ensete ventricosum]|uniref:Uncharacterized protein n=1 Tax=Ensete ventricosum TaxID=4639 RepID=A0A426XXD7_ENSVE|nr:hypothetical protein B296_00025725 [Ensete ventricosum]RWV86967.1 hypothetical protein GW17_00051080 [Ensete ventricosum]RZR97181.1 hypothetical protein BHM03_00026315 [Ensete ventricosum]
MELRSLTMALLLLSPLLVPAVHPSSHRSPSPSPFPSPRRSLPSPTAAVPPPQRPGNDDGLREHPGGVVASRAGDPERLNLGEKVGLAFLAVAVALQVALGAFLVLKKSQLGKLERRERRVADKLYSASSL